MYKSWSKSTSSYRFNLQIPQTKQFWVNSIMNFIPQILVSSFILPGIRVQTAVCVCVLSHPFYPSTCPILVWFSLFNLCFPQDVTWYNVRSTKCFKILERTISFLEFQIRLSIYIFWTLEIYFCATACNFICLYITLLKTKFAYEPCSSNASFLHLSFRT